MHFINLSFVQHKVTGLAAGSVNQELPPDPFIDFPSASSSFARELLRYGRAPYRPRT
jgi:hypothetical protein